MFDAIIQVMGWAYFFGAMLYVLWVFSSALNKHNEINIHDEY